MRIVLSIQKSFLIFFIMLLLSPSFAQKLEEFKKSPSECEYVRNALDQTILSTMGSSDAITIFIFRRGQNENLKGLSNVRVINIKSHLMHRKADLQRYVFAEGEVAGGLGKLEIYIEGKLVWTLYARKNLPFGYDCTAS